MVSYQYDAASRLTRITWPDAVPFYVTYAYDGAGALSSATEVANGVSTVLAQYVYDDLGRTHLHLPQQLRHQRPHHLLL